MHGETSCKNQPGRNLEIPAVVVKDGKAVRRRSLTGKAVGSGFGQKHSFAFNSRRRQGVFSGQAAVQNSLERSQKVGRNEPA